MGDNRNSSQTRYGGDLTEIRHVLLGRRQVSTNIVLVTKEIDSRNGTHFLDKITGTKEKAVSIIKRGYMSSRANGG